MIRSRASSRQRCRRLARLLGIAALLIGGWPRAARPQETTASNRTYLLDFHVGHTATVGGRSRGLVAENGAASLAFAFEATRRSWGWVSFDFRPMTSLWGYRTDVVPPRVGMYAITAGVSRKLGPAIGRTRWLPIEVGLGAGATRVEIMSNGYIGANTPASELPPDAELERVPFELMRSLRWRPAAAARARLSVPIGSAFRLGVGASLLATRVGDVRLWDGGWEPTGTESRYRPTPRVWSFGTVVTAPVTIGLSLKL